MEGIELKWGSTQFAGAESMQAMAQYYGLQWKGCNSKAA
jgi:hypothetical protein